MSAGYHSFDAFWLGGAAGSTRTFNVDCAVNMGLSVSDQENANFAAIAESNLISSVSSGEVADLLSSSLVNINLSQNVSGTINLILNVAASCSFNVSSVASEVADFVAVAQIALNLDNTDLEHSAFTEQASMGVVLTSQTGGNSGIQSLCPR